MIQVDSTNCPYCKGAQWLYDEYDGEMLVPKRCVCLERKLLRDYLGPEIYNVKWVKSELYQPVHNETTGTIEGDRTTESLFIKGTWTVVCQHLRWVLSAKRIYASGFTFKIVTDDRLVKVWLGAEHYKHRPADSRDELETNNSLMDLLSDSSLVIIRLGYIQRNKAAPQVLDEALGVREAVNRPTWLVEDREPYLPGCCASYSDNVAKHIQDKFEIVDLGGNIEEERSERREKIEATTEEMEEFGVAMDTEAPKSKEISDNLYNTPKAHVKRDYFSKKKKGGSGMSELE